MANVKTITATTTESAVEFSATYQFMWFRNFGENDCYICDHCGIVAGADDVTLLKAGEVARLTLPQTPVQSTAYIKAADGSNTVEVHAQNYSDCPFKRQGKGGEQITVESLTATENTTYTAPTGTAYSPVTVSVSPNVGTKIITHDGTYNASSDNLDGYSFVVVDTTPHLPSGYTEIDYAEFPSDGKAGFELGTYKLKAFHIVETKTMPYIVSDGDEHAFAGDGTALELYYDDGKTKVYGTNSVDYLGARNASVNNIYYHRALIKSDSSTVLKLGYYRLNQYEFHGRMYYMRIYDGENESAGIGMLYNFVPCIQDSTSKVGFYDTVNGNFYSSTTGHEFVAPASV